MGGGRNHARKFLWTCSRAELWVFFLWVSVLGVDAGKTGLVDLLWLHGLLCSFVSRQERGNGRCLPWEFWSFMVTVLGKD